MDRGFQASPSDGKCTAWLFWGEPLTRKDLPELIAAARELGFYTNLITSGIGLTAKKLDLFAEAGLDHIQISFQASDETLNAALAGSKKPSLKN